MAAIRINRVSDLAESRGFRIESAWTNGVIMFDLIRISDDRLILEGVGTMDIERYLMEHPQSVK